MKFGSVCSGIEAASVAFNALGWKAQWFSEIEPFPCSVLAHHYPDTPNLGDMTKFQDWPTDDEHAIDLLCGGTPCQSFSVAGLRKGLDDPRGNLMLTYLAIAAKYRPQWLVWENVPGVLSSGGGLDFASLLRGMAELGYGFAYRVLDAQYFGVAQRRRRVFVVGCAGNWHRAAAVLFERHSLQGHPAPSRQTGQEVAGTFTARAKSGGWGQDPNLAAGGYMRAVPHADISPALKARDGKGPSSDGDGDGAILVPMVSTFQQSSLDGKGTFGYDHDAKVSKPVKTQPDGQMIVTHSLRGEGFNASEDGTGRGTPLVPMFMHLNKGRPDGRKSAHTEMVTLETETIPTLTTDGHQQSAIAFAQNQRDEVRMMHVAGALAAEPGMKQQTYCLDINKSANEGSSSMKVRRLTPTECARLQGFPDDYLDITYRGKPAADGPKYKALGNSWAVPNVRWIGQRIEAVGGI